MAAPKRTRGFTLVELLVVITIIGMLVSLLLPAIQSAREAGRRNTCQSNMRNVALALTQYENSKKYFPGYANVLATQGSGQQYRRVSWVVPILPYLERNDLYQNWQNPSYTLDNGGALSNSILPAPSPPPVTGIRSQFVSVMNILVCPSNPSPDLGDNPLSFVVNTGVANTANDTNIASAPSTGLLWPEDANSGVFFNHCNWASSGVNTSPAPLGLTGAKKTNIDFISTNDGTTYTLMMSENLQATNWGTDPTLAAAMTYQTFQYDFSVRQNTGFVWFITGNVNNAGPPTVQPSVPVTNFNFGTCSINDGSKTVTGVPIVAYSNMATAPSGLAYARPSSNHPGGVNACFVGGNMRYINDEIAYNVYTQIMTPNQNSVILVQASGMTPRTQGWNYTLNEADY